MAEMARVNKFIAGLALIFLAVAVLPPAGLAHCFPDQMTPSAASVLSAPPAQVVVHFDQQFNPASTTLRVLNQNGDLVSGAGAPGSDHRTLTVPLKRLSPGQYFVKWRATSQDGDHTMGAYSFTVVGAAR
jgi:copper resistance protein C